MTARRLEHLTHDSWMRPRCSVCTAAREGKIDIPRAEALLAAGARLKPVAAQFGINPYALRRHWLEVSQGRKNYLRFGNRLAQESLQARVAQEQLAVIDHFVLVRNGLHKAFQLAFNAGDYGAIANLARAIDDNVERTARLTGEWKDDQPSSITTNIQILNLPGVAAVVAGVSTALAQYPDARAHVIEYLRGAAALPAPVNVVDVETADAAE
jgi:hypothetical protein